MRRSKVKGRNHKVIYNKNSILYFNKMMNLKKKLVISIMTQNYKKLGKKLNSNIYSRLLRCKSKYEKYSYRIQNTKLRK